MIKPILGILAVFFAQLAFVGYIYLEQPLDTASISPIAILGPPLSIFDSEPDTVVLKRSSGPASAIPVNRKAAAEPVVIAAKRSIRQPSRNSGYQIDHLVAFQKPVVITYRTEYPAAASSVSRESDGRDFTASPKLPSNEKKSLLSKALPVIKKPYDWLKAIGSKMR